MQIEAARLQKSEGKEAEGSSSINECSYEKAYRRARLHKAECRSRRQEAEVEAARLQKSAGKRSTRRKVDQRALLGERNSKSQTSEGRRQPDCRSQRGKEAEGRKSINECSYEKAVRTARLQKAKCGSRSQEAAVSASMRADGRSQT